MSAPPSGDVRVVAAAPDLEPSIRSILADRLAAWARSTRGAPPDAAERAEPLIGRLLDAGHCVAAVDGGRQVLGFLGWHESPTFRRTPRRGAWIPAHGLALADGAEAVLDSLFAAAARRWSESARDVLSISILDGTPAIDRFFVENGFGMLLHDAVIELPVPASVPAGIVARRATPDDAATLAALDEEHCAHYGSAPIWMVPPRPEPESEVAAGIATGSDQWWIAEAAGDAVGFLRCEESVEGGTDLLVDSASVGINGMFVRPASRGAGVAGALLAVAGEALAQQGIERFVLDYETTNPTARRFWPRWSSTVVRSYLRILERP